jgi:hypothetical protein
MAYAGTNYVAVLIAAVVAWLAGAAWYGVLGKPWMAALGVTADEMAARRRQPGGMLPFIYSFAAEIIMAIVMAGLMGHLGPGQVTLRNGIISAGFCWVGFVLTTMLVNNSFAGRSWRLMWIDGGHWLIVLVLIGAILGYMGV